MFGPIMDHLPFWVYIWNNMVGAFPSIVNGDHFSLSTEGEPNG